MQGRAGHYHRTSADAADPQGQIWHFNKEPAVKVLQSMENHWSGLTVFVDHPEVPMDNNTGERTLRTPVTGRKNHYGSGSRWSGEFAAMMFSLLMTVKLWDINPRTWLSAFLHPGFLCWSGWSVRFCGCRARRNFAAWSFHCKELQRRHAPGKPCNPDKSALTKRVDAKYMTKLFRVIMLHVLASGQLSFLGSSACERLDTNTRLLLKRNPMDKRYPSIPAGERRVRLIQAEAEERVPPVGAAEFKVLT